MTPRNELIGMAGTPPPKYLGVPDPENVYILLGADQRLEYLGVPQHLGVPQRWLYIWVLQQIFVAVFSKCNRFCQIILVYFASLWGLWQCTNVSRIWTVSTMVVYKIKF